MASPITLAVTVTAFACALLFIAYDTGHSLAEIGREFSLIGNIIAQDAAKQPASELPAALTQEAARFTQVRRVGIDDGTISESLFSRRFKAGSHGVLTVDFHDTGALAGLGTRSAAALLLATCMSLASIRRRRKSGMPDRLQRDNYRTLAAAVPLGLACWTKAGELIVCNDRYRDRLNLDKSRITYHAAVSRLIAGGYMKLLREDDNNRVLELHREDGAVLLIDERPLADGGFMTLVSDVTEQKRADALIDAIREEQRLLARRYHEEKLKAEAASRSKTAFLAHLSHDVRTPLNHIIGFAELMKHQTYGPLGDPRYVEYVQTIQASGEHLLASFATILELAELESGQRALRQDPVAIDSLVSDIARKYQAQIKRAGVRMDLGIGCGAVVRGDRLGFARMIGNIIENSIRFTPRGGEIRLATFAADDGVVIEVSDTGIGMDDERLSSLSQPFVLGDATFTREGVGQGLGISIARAIAGSSGGHLAIDSTPGIGTTVAISLPLESMIGDTVAAE
ncbi:PAS-domain containing protein [Devosia sp. PTR5]|uniref:histidine kinase n=1 Tax=Devosia oryzisoli TaxID=2774138 RepID=A0A927IQ68_9HYPH|nr:PAS domain-containing sensor histidine kinase [Devosia oryzisoli]MBD8065310.1 PAS-domain containing protein [Devosia oryzisoli]